MTEEQRLAYIEKHPIVPSDEHLKYWDWDGGKEVSAMCILDEIGFTPEQYFELKDKRMTDEEIAWDELDVAPWHLKQWKKKHGVRNEKYATERSSLVRNGKSEKKG